MFVGSTQPSVGAHKPKQITASQRRRGRALAHTGTKSMGGNQSCTQTQAIAICWNSYGRGPRALLCASCVTRARANMRTHARTHTHVFPAKRFIISKSIKPLPSPLPPPNGVSASTASGDSGDGVAMNLRSAEKNAGCRRCVCECVYVCCTSICAVVFGLVYYICVDTNGRRTACMSAASIFGHPVLCVCVCACNWRRKCVMSSIW